MLLLGCVFVLQVFLVLLVLLVLLVRAKYFRKKKEFKTALVTSFTLLLRPVAKMGPKPTKTLVTVKLLMWC